MALAGDPLELRFKTSVGTAQVGDILYRGAATAAPFFLAPQCCLVLPRAVEAWRGRHDSVTAGNACAKPG